MTPLLDMDLRKASKVFDLNVFAPFAVVKAFIPLLITSKGTIVNIGSYVDALPAPWQGVYNASKAALRSLTDNLRLELRPFNVNVVYVGAFHYSFFILKAFLIAMQIAAGGIRSNFLDNLGKVYISETSLFYPARQILEPIMNYEDEKANRTSMPASEFAQEVYDAAVAGVSFHRVYAGSQTPLSNMPAVERVSLVIVVDM